MKKQIILRRRTGYALLLLLSSVLLSCNIQKHTDKSLYSPISGDLIFLTDQSRVGEILAMLANYALYPDVIRQGELVKNNEHLLVIIVHIQCKDNLQLNQVESRLAGANWGIKDIQFIKDAIEDSLNASDFEK